MVMKRWMNVVKGRESVMQVILFIVLVLVVGASSAGEKGESRVRREKAAPVTADYQIHLSVAGKKPTTEPKGGHAVTTVKR